MGFCSMAANVAENFLSTQNRENFNVGQNGKMSPLGMTLFLAIYLTLILFLGKFLWNEVMVKVVSVCKPMPSMLHLLGLVLLIDLLAPTVGCNC